MLDKDGSNTQEDCEPLQYNGGQLDVQHEWSMLRQAAVDSGNVSPWDEFGLDAIVRLQNLLEVALQAQMQRKGVDALLKEGDSILPGLSSFRTFFSHVLIPWLREEILAR